MTKEKEEKFYLMGIFNIFDFWWCSQLTLCPSQNSKEITEFHGMLGETSKQCYVSPQEDSLDNWTRFFEMLTKSIKRT